MDYLLIGVIAALLFVGIVDIRKLGDELRNLSQRRRLLIRLAGFFLMSLWLHNFPSLLMVIYMRENHFLASEVFSGDLATSGVIGLFTLPKILLGAVLFNASPIMNKLYKFGAIESTGTPPWARRTTRAMVLFASPLALGSYLYAVWDSDHIVDGAPFPGRVASFYLLTVVAVTVGLYIFVAIAGSVRIQLKLYLLPLAVIGILTIAMFEFSSTTASIVEDQLAVFSAGGTGAKVSWRGEQLDGRLLLVTSNAIYLQMLNFPASEGASTCLLRIPIQEATLETSVFYLNRNTRSTANCNLKDLLGE